MLQNIDAPEIASYEVQQEIIKKCYTITNDQRRKKYLCIVFLCIDAGLRPSEIASMQIGDIDFRSGEFGVMNVRTAKQKTSKETGEKRVKIRKIPMTTRLRDALANHSKELKLTNEYQVLFPADREVGHMDRRTVWRIIRRLSGKKTNPKTLRHTFATKIVENDGIRTAQYLMGHASQQTTEIYSHINPIAVQRAISHIDRKTIGQRIKDFFFPRQVIGVVNFTGGQLSNFHVGREKEMKRLEEAGEKGVNILILGEQGSGKTHLLDNYQKGKIIRVDDLRYVKKALQGILIYLFNDDKESIALALSENVEIRIDESGKEKQVWDKRILIDSIKNLTKLLVKVTEKGEYTLVIDDVERIANTGVIALEFLKNHFHIIVAARKIPLSKATFLTNFDKLYLKPLSRPETMELIELASKDIRSRIENYDMLCNKIWDNCRGVPQFTLEYIDRVRKEPGKIDFEVISNIEHTAARPEIDMSIPFLVAISSLMILRYYGRETDDRDAYLFLGSIFMMIALFARPLLTKGKRKYV